MLLNAHIYSLVFMILIKLPVNSIFICFSALMSFQLDCKIYYF